jgi:hypothetical protein
VRLLDPPQRQASGVDRAGPGLGDRRRQVHHVVLAAQDHLPVARLVLLGSQHRAILRVLEVGRGAVVDGHGHGRDALRRAEDVTAPRPDAKQLAISHIRLRAVPGREQMDDELLLADRYCGRHAPPPEPSPTPGPTASRAGVIAAGPPSRKAPRERVESDEPPRVQPVGAAGVEGHPGLEQHVRPGLAGPLRLGTGDSSSSSRYQP